MAPESCNLDKDEAEVLKPAASASASATSSTSSPSPPPQPPTLFLKPPQESPVPRPETAAVDARDRAITPTPEKEEEERSQPLAAARAGNRCSSCQRRVGLTGFRCRCGDLFCGRHRYSDIHDCSFDYKAAGREQISKANPVIRAAKIIKI